MSDEAIALRNYVFGWNAALGRWELRLGFGGGGEDSVVARSTPDEDKDAFETICRNYVRRHSLSAQRHLPRCLTIQSQDGEVLEDASYDVDAMT